MGKKEETKIEDAFVELVRNGPHTAMAIKLVLFAGGGFPDRTILGNGKCFFIEFKKPGEDLDKLQVVWKKRLKKLGMKFYVCTSSQKAYQIFIKEMGST